MEDQTKMMQAKKTYETLCKLLDEKDWKYKKNEEKLQIECGAQGEDLPMEITIAVDAERMLIILLSAMPFSVPEDKRLEVAIAVSAINNRLVDGSFDYNVATGSMFFRMTNSFIESTISADVFLYLLICSCKTIDEYNDKLMLLSSGTVSIEKFLSALN